MSHLNVWKASNTLDLKFPQIIDGMNVLLVTWRQENEHIMHLRTHVIMRHEVFGPQEIPFRHFGGICASLGDQVWGGNIPKST